MAESSSGVQSGGRKSLIYALVAVTIILVVVAGVGWGLYVTKVPGTTLSQKENQVTALAYQHWQAKVDRSKAIEALKKADGEVAQAIIDLATR